MPGQFKRVLGKWDIFSLSFGAMIGWGWVVLTSKALSLAGIGGAILAFVTGGIIVALIALTYAELTSAMPKVGGEHIFSYRGLGLDASFACTWLILLGYVSVCAFEAVALPVIMDSFLPLSDGDPTWTIMGKPVYASWVAISIAGSLAIGVLNYYGISTAAWVQKVFTALILLAGVGLIFGALGKSGMEIDIPFWQGEKVSGGWLAALVITPFLYVGFDVIPQAAEEINLPFRQIGRILMLSVVMAILWYAGIAWSVGSVLGSKSFGADLAPMDAMVVIYAHPLAKSLMIWAGLAGILTSWNSFFIGTTRALFAMGQARMLPARFARLHPTYQSPTGAIIFVTLTSILAALFGKEAMTWVVNAGGLGIVAAWALVALAFLRLRRIAPEMPRPFTVPLGRLVGMAAFLLSIGIIALYFPGNPAALQPVEWSMIGIWILLGLGLYAWAMRTYGRDAMRSAMDDHLADSPED